ncbi:MAG: hypothetical protein GY774_31205 [Planctomycetes bacterium]|nr:hypothetical protein [Planctomycetota bacterium]
MTIYHILMTKYQRQFTNEYQHSTKDYVRKNQQIMQNKANSPVVLLDVNNFITMIYAISKCLMKVKNKPNSNPNKANFSQLQGMAKPIQSQTNPIKLVYGTLAR